MQECKMVKINSYNVLGTLKVKPTLVICLCVKCSIDSWVILALEIVMSLFLDPVPVKETAICFLNYIFCFQPAWDLQYDTVLNHTVSYASYSRLGLKFSIYPDLEQNFPIKLSKVTKQ